MAPILRLHKGRVNHRAWLFSVVFASKLSLLTVIILFASLLIQPIHKTFAAEPLPEEETAAESVVPDEVKEQAPVEDDVDVSNISTPESEEVNQDEPLTEDDVLISDSEDEVQNNEESQDIESTENIILDESPSPSTEVATATTTDSATSSVVTISPTQEAGVQENDVDIEVVEAPVTQLEPITTEDNFYQFSKQSCVAVGDGTFHCTKVSENAADVNAVVYAELGKNKNMEIYLRTSKGSVQQITDNYFDDTAPVYDADSLRIVWQRLIDGRYQIMAYDIAEKKETQLTFSRTNNMEPKVSNEGVVWQAWDGNDWEIMYFDGVFTDQITDNNAQDVTPVIDDGYILWSVLGSDEQEAKVYTLSNKQITTITGYNGGTIANPRFVLVYDTKFDNGDIITQGFDPLTGLSAPISTQPAQEPVNIPESDPIGEIRALIQNKSYDEDEFDIDNTTPDSGAGPFDSSSTTAAVAPGTLVLGQASTTDQSNDLSVDAPLDPISDSIEQFELTEYDLVIAPTSTGEVVVSTTSVQSEEL